MTSQQEVSHRQEREHKKQEHAGPTPGKFLASTHVTWALVIGVILMLAAVMIWTFGIPA